jgi:RHS repeat-associated protein
VRVKKTDTRGALGLQVNDFSYGPQGLLWSSNPNTVHTPGFGHRSNGINTFYHHDWLGSTRYTSDITGNTFPQALRFDAFGNRSATGGTAPYHSTDLQWAGAWGYQTEWSNGASDPGLGLAYLEQRYYDPAVGRFISPDPIGFAGGLNLYGYVANDPVSGVDPSGTSNVIDDWAAWTDERLAYRQEQINQAVPNNWMGIGLATAANSALTWTATITKLPHTIWHFGEGFGNPSNYQAFWSDVGTACSFGLLGLGSLAGRAGTAGEAGEAAEAGAGRVAQEQIQHQSGPARNMVSSKASQRVAPGVRIVRGQYVRGGRVEPWTAYYDEQGRIIGRTDYNAGNRAANIPDIHYHLYRWGRGLIAHEYGKHIPGEYVPNHGE